MAPTSTVSALVLLLNLSVTSALPSLNLQSRDNLVPFNAAQQYVSNKGAHAFIAPGSGDARSPCPALNVMANHGYIPRNGLLTIPQAQQGLVETFGIAPDLASVLALIFLGATKQGDLYSIGGFPSTFEGVGPYQFIQTYGIGDINAANPMQQICTNYNAINGSQYHVADQFSMGGSGNDELFFRVFGNKSAEYPLGSLNAASKLSMLAMTPNGDGTFTWNKFMNAIPDYWYKSNKLAQLTTALFASDIVLEGVYGCFAGYMGSSNTNFALLTNGAYSNADVKDPNTFMCFLSQAAPLVLPTLANQFDTATQQGVATAVSGIGKATQNLQCGTVMKSINMQVLGSLLGLQL